MPTYQLQNYQDMAIEMGFSGLPGAYEASGYGGSNSKLVKTFDTDTQKITFAYPGIKTGSDTFVEAKDFINAALKNDKFKRYASKIASEELSDHLAITMDAEVFGKIYGDEIRIKLNDPVNLVGQYAPEVSGSANLTDGVLQLDKKRVTLAYDDIHTTSGMQDAHAAIMANAPDRHKNKLTTSVQGGSFVLSMPLGTYQELSGQKIPLGRPR
jgi:hypothetical protein